MRHVHDFDLGLAGPILAAEARAQFDQSFPLQPAVLGHNLANHPLLSLEMLALAAGRMKPEHVECRSSATANGHEFAHAGTDRVADTIRNIGEAGRWVMLRFAEQLPEFADLLSQLLAEIEPVVGRFGRPLNPQAFIFISSPGTLTPFHFDPEFNILFQIAGQKRFATYPVVAPWLDNAKQALFHRDGDNLLSWDPAYAEAATVHTLNPGDALFVPYKASHWVEVAEEPSISLSLTWSCAVTLELEAAWQLHGWLAEHGISSKAPPAFPGRSPWQAGLRRGLGMLGLV